MLIIKGEIRLKIKLKNSKLLLNFCSIFTLPFKHFELLQNIGNSKKQKQIVKMETVILVFLFFQIKND